MRWVNRREGEKLFAFERATAARADICLFVSEAEAALFRERAPGSPTSARCPTASTSIILRSRRRLRAARRERAERAADRLHRPDGLSRPMSTPCAWFARDGAAAACPGARFAIAGRNPPPAVRALAGRDGVIVTGAVADMRSWLAAADVVVAPLQLARGIQNKVLEAMAMAQPVVASPAAFEGIEAVPGPRPARRRRRRRAGRGDPRPARRLRSAPPRWAPPPRRRMEDGYRWDARLAPLAAMRRPAGRKAGGMTAALALPAEAAARSPLARASRRARRSPAAAILLPCSTATPPTSPRSGGRARPSTIAC